MTLFSTLFGRLSDFFRPPNIEITDGTDTALASNANGQRFLLAEGDSAAVDGAPLLIVENDRVQFNNAGLAETAGESSTVVFQSRNGTLDNARSGEIRSEDTGVEIVDEADIDNDGLIDGAINGVSFANGGASEGTLRNGGTITSDSRAVNIGGSGIAIINHGQILGTGDQRNGTVYSDATADDYVIFNYRAATIDASEGNVGAGVALETGSVDGDEVNARVDNAGVIAGRGQGAADTGLAGDGLRIFAGAEGVTFDGDIRNSGSITSESLQGPTAGLRVANGVNFDGRIDNQRDGLIAGENNGLYFGTGAHDARVENNGNISSGSRAVNIDGTGVELINDGRIFGTGDQRNGTVYADSTADEYRISNARRASIDAGDGNDGSAISLQTGDVDDDTVTASVANDGVVRGRGDAIEGNGVGDGIRLFSEVENATFAGDIVNRGIIRASEDADEAVGISVENGIDFTGTIENRGQLFANQVAIDASEAGGSVRVVNDGRIDGDVVLSDGDDRFEGGRSRFQTEVDGGAGDDNIQTGRGRDLLTGGLGEDILDGGRNRDTAAYEDVDVSANVDLERGTATRQTGFGIDFEDVAVEPLTLNPDLSGNFIAEALGGNLYFNVHTNDFNGGEIRGQLDNIVDNTVDGTGTIILSGGLDADQEPDPVSTSDATGFGTVTIEVVDGIATTYSLELDISGISPTELLPVNGVSSIHLHNAPRGVNGPVTLDAVQDANGDIEGVALSPDADTGDGNVFGENRETDTLIDIEDLVGSNDGDLLAGDRNGNSLQGQDGDDILNGRAGNDWLEGGDGVDTFVFEGRSDRDTITDFTIDDKLDLTSAELEFDNFQGVLDDARQVDANTIIDLGDGDRVTLLGFELDQLIEENVLF